MTQCKYFITKNDDSTPKTSICDKLVPKCNKILRWSTVNPAFNKVIKQCGTVWWLGLCVMWHRQISLSSETALATIGWNSSKIISYFYEKTCSCIGGAHKTQLKDDRSCVLKVLICGLRYVWCCVDSFEVTKFAENWIVIVLATKNDMIWTSEYLHIDRNKNVDYIVR